MLASLSHFALRFSSRDRITIKHLISLNMKEGLNERRTRDATHVRRRPFCRSEITWNCEFDVTLPVLSVQCSTLIRPTATPSVPGAEIH